MLLDKKRLNHEIEVVFNFTKKGCKCFNKGLVNSLVFMFTVVVRLIILIIYYKSLTVSSAEFDRFSFTFLSANRIAPKNGQFCVLL